MALTGGSDLRSVHLRMGDPSAVGEARRRADRIAYALGFDETLRGRVAIVVQELASNAIRHAGRGELFLRVTERGRLAGLEIVCADAGPGIADVGKALRDGYSTGGTSGTGLGAIRRLSQRFDIFASPRGTVVVAELWPGEPEVGMEASSVVVPIDPEGGSGDAIRIVRLGDRLVVCIVDALGHGLGAAETAKVAIAAFDANVTQPVSDTFRAIDGALRSTRGAAVGVVEVDQARRLLRAAGVGNVAGLVVGGDRDHAIVFANGIAGHNVRRYDVQQLPWPKDGFLILHTDGLRSHWDIHDYVAVTRRHPAVAAAVLYRDHRRGNDDVGIATVADARMAA